MNILLLLLLNDGQEEKLAELLIDRESWNLSSTGMHWISHQDCVFHYFCFLLQDEYRIFLQQKQQTITIPLAGCLVTSEFASIFSVLASYIENGYSICNNIVLQYALFFMAPEVSVTFELYLFTFSFTFTF